ncbi:unnamed protein product [Durusdinium trenchii]|uniref:Pentatricopeptide repeat-containing protein, chloroplastic n=1 Tax=Durusdinium trenchii TaxID=1381693 RepID=A0ABP0JR30_9DINO
MAWSPRLRDGTSEISALGRQSRWEAAIAKCVELYNEELQPGIVTYNSLLSALDKASQSVKALHLLQLLRSDSVTLQPDIVSFCSVASASSRGQDWPQSLHLLWVAKCEGLEPNTFTGNAAITALERGGQWHLAIESLIKALEHGPCPDRITFNTVITALGRSSRWEEAVAMLEELEKHKLEPNTVSFNSATAACAGGSSDSCQAWKVGFHLLRRGSSQIASFPEVQACSSALSACARAGCWQQALQTFSVMRHHGPFPDVAACGALLDAFDQAGLWPWSLWLLEQMWRPSGEKSLPRPDVAALTSAISACSMQIQWEKALHLLQSSRAKLDSPALYNAAAGACERGLQVDILLEIFRVMMETHLEADAITYLALISTCGKTQRWNEALLHFQSALHSSIAMSQSLMNSAISACEKGSSWLSAISLLHFEKLLMTPNIVSSSAVITASAANAQWLPSIRLLDDMRFWQLRPDLVALNSILDAAEASAQWLLATHSLIMMNTLRLHTGCMSLSAAIGSHEEAGWQLPGLLQRLETVYVDEIRHSQGTNEGMSSLSHLLEAEEILGSNDVMSWKGHQALHTLLCPALRRLIHLTRVGPGSRSQLWEPLLERQFSLGAGYTMRALLTLDFAATVWDGALLPRRELGRVNEEPVAESLPGFLAISMQNHQTCGRVIGYGGAELGALRPVFVQHDRSRHAERLALLSVIACLGAP